MRQTVGVILEAIYYDVVRTSSARRTRVVRQHLRSRCCYICDDACDSVLIENNGVAPEWGCTYFQMSQPILKQLH